MESAAAYFLILAFVKLFGILAAVFVLCSGFCLAQNDSFQPAKYRYGLVAYYFWEEDSSGNIISAIEQPFEKNFIVLIDNEWRPASTVGSDTFTQAIEVLCKQMRKERLSTSRVPVANTHRKKKLAVKRQLTDHAISVIYRKTPYGWVSDTARNILQFDSIVNVRMTGSVDQVNNHPTTFLGTCWKTADSSYYRAYFPLAEQGLPQHDLFFINGYRRLRRHVTNNQSDGLMASYDRYTYWFKLDDLFIGRIQPDRSLYFDGSFGVSTSNHRNKLKFGWSYFRAGILKKKKSRTNYNGFNLKSNKKGFDERLEAGKLAGKVFLSSRSSWQHPDGVIDTIDIVSHSMGYAYALGFLQVVENHAVLNNCYIVAPENAGYKGYDWSKFRHVWQYGTNLDQPNADPIWLQDGVAPQTAVKGIQSLPPEKGGRLFTPRDWPKRNFVDSHMVYNYYWIFELLKRGMAGYVQ